MDKLSRRKFLQQTAGITLGAASLSALSGTMGAGSANAFEVVALEESHAIADAPRRLRLINAHTAEKLSVVFWQDGRYLQDSLDKINFLLRDFRVNEVMQIDTNVLEYLHQVYTRMDTEEHIQVLSGYRSPETNEMLRKRSSGSGVAKNSLHIIGKAIDFKIPGRQTKALQETALDLHIGGIGYYRKSDFVHIDSGPHRSWS